MSHFFNREHSIRKHYENSLTLKCLLFFKIWKKRRRAWENMRWKNSLSLVNKIKKFSNLKLGRTPLGIAEYGIRVAWVHNDFWNVISVCNSEILADKYSLHIVTDLNPSERRPWFWGLFKMFLYLDVFQRIIDSLWFNIFMKTYRDEEF